MCPAAANTLVPCCSFQSARRELNPRPASYKDAALTVELRASESRVGGNRTHTVQIKSLLCCLLHHDPVIGLVYAFQSLHERHRCSPSCFAFSGSPGNRTQHDSVISRVWATSPRLPFSSRVLRSRTRAPTAGWSPPGPKPGVLPSAPVPDMSHQSERQDSNLRSPAPDLAR